MDNGNPMQPGENRPRELLALPGPRILWWLLGSLAISLVIGAVVVSSMGAAPSLGRQIDVEVRFRSLLWRTTESLGSARPTKPLRRVAPVVRGAAKKRPAVDAPLAATTTEADAASLLEQLQETNQQSGKDALRDLFARARDSDVAAAKDALHQHPERGATGVGRAAELVVAHAVSTHEDRLAAELAGKLGSASPDLRAALAALPVDPSATVPLNALPLLEARERARSHHHDRRKQCHGGDHELRQRRRRHDHP